MNSAAVLDTRDEPAVAHTVRVVRMYGATFLIAYAPDGRVLAYLRERDRALFIAAYRHALDARTLGGVRSLIETVDLVADPPVRFAAAVRIAADMHGVNVEWLDRHGRPMVTGAFGEDLFGQMTADVE
ncbi:hypothetical protein RA307_30515 [Xanthobacteraceae bacterium Astr-EGSB]|uniref:hypothetical protein n=1 Tax=Astrobacterium formosum TaxID=3069710 RepID=UPI0027B1524A|nr:hypothetical protein [Xanthobacteraceae bacterium Astr-EGSB]